MTVAKVVLVISGFALQGHQTLIAIKKVNSPV